MVTSQIDCFSSSTKNSSTITYVVSSGREKIVSIVKLGSVLLHALPPRLATKLEGRCDLWNYCQSVAGASITTASYLTQMDDCWDIAINWGFSRNIALLSTSNEVATKRFPFSPFLAWLNITLLSIRWSASSYSNADTCYYYDDDNNNKDEQNKDNNENNQNYYENNNDKNNNENNNIQYYNEGNEDEDDNNNNSQENDGGNYYNGNNQENNDGNNNDNQNDNDGGDNNNNQNKNDGGDNNNNENNNQNNGNVAYSLYGVLDNSKAESGNSCSKANYVNSFFTTDGLTTFAYASVLLVSSLLPKINLPHQREA
jgi:hypothetical protein